MKFYVIYRDLELKGGSSCTVCMPEKRFPLKGQGLVNGANHCYANAVIQMLLTATGLFHDSETLRKIKDDMKQVDIWDEEVFNLWDEEVFNLILSLRDTTSKRTCIKKFTGPNGYAAQQDAQEFLQYLLNASFPFSLLRPYYTFSVSYKQFKQKNCTEFFSTSKSETHSMLELIPSTSLSLQGLLNSMSECENIAVGHKDIKSRKINLDDLQKYLFIHLRIFTGDGSRTERINTPTPIEEYINIGVGDDQLVYEIIAVVYHSGTYKGDVGRDITKSAIQTYGHYTCKAKRSEPHGTTSIYYYDDNSEPERASDFTPPTTSNFVPYLVLCERIDRS
jgi:ubiquitin C-terminal hydrolase